MTEPPTHEPASQAKQKGDVVDLHAGGRANSGSGARGSKARSSGSSGSPSDGSGSASSSSARSGSAGSTPPQSLTQRQHEVLTYIDRSIRERGYPPSVREIGDAVGLASPSSVHNHLHTLERLGYLRRDPTKPRAIEVTSDTESQTTAERRPTRHVPLVGDVAAGTGVLAQEQVEELVPLPADFTGDGELFMLRVRGDSMIDAGILDGDFVVARVEPQARTGDTVVAGIPGEEATIKGFRKDGSEIVLEPANPSLEPMRYHAGEVQIYGIVVTVLRKL